MKNRPEDTMSEGRISREVLVAEEYKHKKQAEIDTIRNYFSSEWFDDTYIRSVNVKNTLKKIRTSNYPLQKCPVCKKTWNFFIAQENNRKKKTVKYWDDFERLPKPKEICPKCQ